MVKTCKSMLFCNGRRDPNSLIRSCDLSLSLWFLSFTVICFKYYSMLFSGLDKCNIFFSPWGSIQMLLNNCFLSLLNCFVLIVWQDRMLSPVVRQTISMSFSELFFPWCPVIPLPLKCVLSPLVTQRCLFHFDYLLKLFYVSV